MTERRANPDRLFRLADGLGAGSDMFVYTTTDTIEQITLPHYFMRLHTRLNRCDLIQVRAQHGENLERLSIGTFAVLGVKFQEVTVGVYEPFREIVPIAEDKPQPAAASADSFIRGSGIVKWNPGAKKHEVWVGDAVVFASPDKAVASAVARGDAAIPQPEPAVA